jgi:hypothetical protein|tara:strand:- start:231 stop:620 length:390 start_codon:yes stop_codon:yes gene_type:complete
MVWSQYVYEATVGFETSHASDDEDLTDDTPLNVEDWEVQYSDELWYMWGMMNTLLEDAYIEHTGKFCDFVEFCYMEHECVVWEYQEEKLSHIWKHLRRVVNQNGHHKEMMRGATFYHFVDYAKNYMCIY